MDASRFALQAIAFVLTYAIHSTLLLGIACLVAPHITRSFALRERVWKVALLGGVFTALVQVCAGWQTPLVHWTLDDATQQARVDAPHAASDATN